jgi:hypothetical protein
VTVDPYNRHAEPHAGHPRLCARRRSKTWMAGTSPAMTRINLVQIFLRPLSPLEALFQGKTLCHAAN